MGIITTVYDVDPDTAVRRALHVAAEMNRAGRPGQLYLRDELERIARNMCPFCGNHVSHEDAEHKFVAARRIFEEGPPPDRNVDGTVRTR